jgi:hypothetical protein
MSEKKKKNGAPVKDKNSTSKTQQAAPQPPESTEGLSRGLKALMEYPNSTKGQGRMGFIFPGPEPPRKK